MNSKANRPNTITGKDSKNVEEFAYLRSKKPKKKTLRSGKPLVRFKLSGSSRTSACNDKLCIFKSKSLSVLPLWCWILEGNRSKFANQGSQKTLGKILHKQHKLKKCGTTSLTQIWGMLAGYHRTSWEERADERVQLDLRNPDQERRSGGLLWMPYMISKNEED